jgi:cytochrome c peroxidase
MWDGRESLPGKTLRENLKHQSNSATVGHAQGSSLSDDLQDEIVQFEMGLHTAQAVDSGVGRLDVAGATGGATALGLQEFFIGINDPLGQNPTGAEFGPSAFNLFAEWLDGTDSRRRSIARGERIFNTRPIAITNVGGLNDVLGLASIPGTCTTCHDAPNAGNHSVALAINIGVNDVSRRTPDLPVITLQRKSTREVVRTLDPGRALITGKWADIGKTKGPILRGLAARAPYFHNGSAATLLDIVNFYDSRFSLALTAEEKSDLVRFLSAL